MLTACLAAGGCGKDKAATSKPAAPPGENPITAPVDYLGAVAKAQRSAVRTVDIASLTQALKMFEAEEGRFPTNLQELVLKGTLQVLPNPPAGSKFDYDPKTGQVKVVPQ